MFGSYFYHEHTRRAVAVFGTLFNNITVRKRDGSGNVLSQIKVPLSYGPRQKFLSRLRREENLNDPKLALKLPRMSFEITSLDYDESVRLTRGSTYTIPSNNAVNRTQIFHPSTYRLGFELSIISKHQDDALQILEQILPYFQPEYTVTVNEIDNNLKTDMPFSLSSVDLSDDYEGDFESRRSIIYTLSFETRIRFFGPTDAEGKIIRKTLTNISDVDMTSSGEPYLSKRLEIIPQNAGPNDPYSIQVTYEPKLYEGALLEFTTLTGNQSCFGY